MRIPTNITLKNKSNLLEVTFGAETYQLSAEYLRVYSPSAEVQGHAPSQAKLQTGKLHVKLTGAEPQGNYAIRLIFNDGHNSGIYTWNYLYELGLYQSENWQSYLDKLSAAKATRDPDISVIKLL
jgi:DUF971 family protein